MADKKKDKLALVKVSDLNEEEFDAAIDDALDFLLGESKDQESAKENKPAAKKPFPGKSSPQKPGRKNQ